MASGLEIVSLINGSIEIVKLIKDFYNAIKSFDGLPKAFEEVNNQLPLVQNTLERAKEKVPKLDSATKVPVKGILQECEKNTKGLLDIFEALKNAEGKSIRKVYNRAVILIGKRGRVEDLMKDTLSSMKRLAENQVFQLADQVEGLQKAIDLLAKVAPSIPDAELERMFASTGFQQIGDNNIQNANSGDTYNTSGNNHTVNTAGSGTFHQTNNSYDNQESRWTAVHRWLEPRSSDFHYQQNATNTNDLQRSKYESRFLEDTGQWLFESTAFQDWFRPGSPTKVFWLYGEPGHGKSVLCARAILGFEGFFKSRFKRPAQAAFHFYDYSSEPERPTTVYRILADSLFRQKYNIRDEISDRVFALAGAANSESMFKEFINVIIEELKVAYIFLDGLDEVFHDEVRKQLAIETLKFCLGLTTKEDADVKVWCSSQNLQEIYSILEKFECCFHQPLTEKENKVDIRRFIYEEAKKMLDEDVAFEKLQALLMMTNTIKGNFLWANFAMDAIKGACSSRQLNDLLKDLPSSFEEYLRKKIRCIKPNCYKIFSQVLSCLVYAKRPLTFGELSSAVGGKLYPPQIKEKCAPFVRIEPESKDNMNQSICSVYHTTVRRFLERNPRALQPDDQSKSNPNEDISISPRILAYATLRYLQQPRYRLLLRPQETHASATFMAAGPLTDPSDIIDHDLLIYSAKYWAKHVNEFWETCKNNEICQEVERFVRSDNFGTCLQVQSLFVQAKFSTWYEDDKEEGHFYSSEHDNRNKPKHFIRNLPSCFTDSPSGMILENQYQDAIAEWGYFLGFASAIHGDFRGEIDKCQWPSLGKSNFMHRIESRLGSYRLEKDRESGASENPGSATSYFLKCERDARDIQVISLQELSRKQKDKTQVEVQRWTRKKPDDQHKPRKAIQSFEVLNDQLRLYTLPLKYHQVGRAERAAITGDGGLLRVGSSLYARDDAGGFRPLDLGDPRIDYVEDMYRSGPWVAIVHRRGVKPAEPMDDHGQLSETSSGWNGEPAAEGEEEDHSMAFSESSSNSGSDSSDGDSSNEGSVSLNIDEVQECEETEIQPQADDMDLDSESSNSSNSARESHSDGSTTEVSDELCDDDFWNDWYSENENIMFKEVGDLSDQSSIMAPSVASMPSEDADIEMTVEIHLNKDDIASDASSNISLKSTIPLEMWGDSDSASERSDEPEITATEDTAEERASDRRQLVIFCLDPSTNQTHRLFRFDYRWAGKLFNSPPVIHPIHALAVWPLGRNEILFANFANSPEKTYFIRSLGCGARDICHISVQAKFSDCGRFLHLACLDGHLSESSSSQSSDTKTKTTAALRNLYLRVSTYRLSQGKPARSPPKLVYRAAVPLDCHLLREGGDSRLPASPLPYAITWTVDHVYATESYRVLRVYRVPLYRRVEQRELGEDVQQRDSCRMREAPESDSDASMNDPKPLQVAFSNEVRIFLPNSANRRSVQFFLAPDKTTTSLKSNKKRKGKAKPSSKLKEEKSEGDKIVATVVISPEDNLLAGMQPYIGPPQIIPLKADEFGPWKRLHDDDSGQGTGQLGAKVWRGGQLEARYEKFDRREDCDIVPYFR